MAGRPPKSIEQHKADGTYQKCRHENRGVKNLTTIQTIDPPKDLTKEAKEVWRDIIPELCKNNLIAVQDLPILYEAFVCYGCAQDLLHYANEGDGIKTGAVYCLGIDYRNKDPMREYLNYMKRFNEIMFKFGVTPVERARIRTGTENKKEDDDSAIKDIIGNG